MPQLDLLTFFPQVFWGFLFFFFLFFTISYYFLPLLASTLKFKQKYLSILLKKEGMITNSTQISTQESSNSLILSSIKEIELIFGNVSKLCEISDKNCRLNLLTNTFKNVNNHIVKTPFLFSALPRFYTAFCFPLSTKKAN
jgi:hypothetical protein